MTSLSMRVSCLVASVVLGAGAAAMSAGSAGAAVTCPTVNPSTGAVQPAPAAGVDWAGCDLAGANLASATLSDANLSSADLSGANLSTANLNSANIASANLGGADMTYIQMESAQAQNAYMAGADLLGADMDFMTASAVDLTGATLNGSDAYDASLVGADFANANLSSADLSGANLSQVSSGGIAGTPSSLPPNWQLTGGYLLGPDAELIAANLPGLDLAGLDLSGAVMPQAKLEGTNLSGADLGNADLEAAVATNADLSGADLADANVSSVDLNAANLTSVNGRDALFSNDVLTKVTMTGANLAGASLTRAYSAGVIGTPAALPTGWVLRSGILLGPGVEFGGGNYSGLNLSGTDLAGADAVDANFNGADLFGANLTKVFWTGATCPDGTKASAHANSCAGALSFHFTGFRSPKPKSTLAGSTRHITATFRLTSASGAVISNAIGASLTSGKQVRARLTGPGIKAAIAYCSWSNSARQFGCKITVPRGIKAGKKHAYKITVAEKPASGFVTAPIRGKVSNPEIIYFR